MAKYNFRCSSCGMGIIAFAPIADGPPDVSEDVCLCGESGTIRRNYRADEIAVAQVAQETYSPSMGRSFTDQRQIDDHLKQVTEDSFNRSGYIPQLRAIHPSEAAPIEGDSLDNVYRQQMDRGERSPKIIHTVSD